MTQQTETKYAIRSGEPRSGTYAFRQPQGPGFIGGHELDNQYTHKPTYLPKTEARRVLAEMVARYGGEWSLEVAPDRCPGCGRVMWSNDGDFCYPENRERTLWRAGCNEHDFGCGFEVQGGSFNDVMTLWNSAARKTAAT